MAGTIGILKKFLFSMAIFLLLILLPELVLRLAGFRYEAGIRNRSDAAFLALRPEQYNLFVPDRELFWKLPPSSPHVNSLGFPGAEIITPKPKNIFRILFLGDSVTQLGYARLVQYLLNSHLASDSLRFECCPLAISGYSSYQGRKIAELYGGKLEPDLAFIFFGWNDHWLAYQAPDSKCAGGVSANLIWQVYHNFRLLQWVNKIYHSVFSVRMRGIVNEVRVSATEYEANLSRIKQVFDSLAIPVIFLTAPTSHYRLGVPDYLIQEKLALSKDSVTEFHKKYNQIVRQVAIRPGSYLLDLEKDFDTLPDLRRYFIQDGIHFTREGMDLTATRIYEFIRANFGGDLGIQDSPPPLP